METHGPFSRLVVALLRLLRRQPSQRRFGNGDNPPPEDAGVPARPRHPAPTLNAAAEAELPPDSD